MINKNKDDQEISQQDQQQISLEVRQSEQIKSPVVNYESNTSEVSKDHVPIPVQQTESLIQQVRDPNISLLSVQAELADHSQEGLAYLSQEAHDPLEIQIEEQKEAGAQGGSGGSSNDKSGIHQSILSFGKRNQSERQLRQDALTKMEEYMAQNNIVYAHQNLEHMVERQPEEAQHMHPSISLSNEKINEQNNITASPNFVYNIFKDGTHDSWMKNESNNQNQTQNKFIDNNNQEYFIQRIDGQPMVFSKNDVLIGELKQIQEPQPFIVDTAHFQVFPNEEQSQIISQGSYAQITPRVNNDEFIESSPQGRNIQKYLTVNNSQPNRDIRLFDDFIMPNFQVHRNRSQENSSRLKQRKKSIIPLIPKMYHIPKTSQHGYEQSIHQGQSREFLEYPRPGYKNSNDAKTSGDINGSHIYRRQTFNNMEKDCYRQQPSFENLSATPVFYGQEIDDEQNQNEKFINEKFGDIQKEVNVHLNQIYQESGIQFKELYSKLQMSKMFLNMIVQEIRHPATQMNMGLQSTTLELRDLVYIHKDQMKFNKKCSALVVKTKSQINQIQCSPIKHDQNMSINLKNLNERQIVDDNEGIIPLMNKQTISQKLESVIKEIDAMEERYSLNQQSVADKMQEQLNLLLIDQFKDSHEIMQEQEEEKMNVSELQECDFQDEDVDEDFFAENPDENDNQIINHPMSSFAQNKLKILEKNNIQKANSKLIDDKKRKMWEDIQIFLKKYNCPSQDRHIQQFLDSVLEIKGDRNFQLQEPDSSIYSSEKTEEKQDACTQVNFDKKLKKQAEKFHNLKEKLQNISDLAKNDKDLEKMQIQHMDDLKSLKSMLKMIYDQEDTISKKQIEIQTILYTQAQYYSEVFEIIFKKTNDAQKILKRQIFSQHMLENLINDLLDLAKLEDNSFKLAYDYFSLSNTIFQAFQLLNFSLIEKDVEIQAIIDKEINLNLVQMIHGDQRRYLQILLNFLSNSLKFTNRGGMITIKVEILDEQLKERSKSDSVISELMMNAKEQLLSNKIDGKDKINFIKQKLKISSSKKQESSKDVKSGNSEHTEGQERFIKIRIRVIDTGVGMTKEEAQKLFIDFGKLDKNSQRNSQGTGLGLSICKKIIEKMGGSVDVQSQKGIGTEFIIDIKTTCIVQQTHFDDSMKSQGSNNLYSSGDSRGRQMSAGDIARNEQLKRILSNGRSSREQREKIFLWKKKWEHEIQSCLLDICNQNISNIAKQGENQRQLFTTLQNHSYQNQNKQRGSYKLVDDGSLKQEQRNIREATAQDCQVLIEQLLCDNQDNRSVNLRGDDSIKDKMITGSIKTFQQKQSIVSDGVNIQSFPKDKSMNIYKSSKTHNSDSFMSFGQQDQILKFGSSHSSSEKKYFGALYDNSKRSKVDPNKDKNLNLSIQAMQDQNDQVQPFGANTFSKIDDSQVSQRYIGSLSHLSSQNQLNTFKSMSIKNNNSSQFSQTGLQNNSAGQLVQVNNNSSGLFQQSIINQNQSINSAGQQIINQNLNKIINNNSSSQIKERTDLNSSLIKKNYKCLIANDDQIVLQLQFLLFKMNSFDVTLAQNGHEAFEEVEKTFIKDEEGFYSNLFDLIILDLRMPITDGFEAIESILDLYKEKASFFIKLRSSDGSLIKSSDPSSFVNSISALCSSKSNPGRNSQEQKQSIESQPQKISVKNIVPLIIACSSEPKTDNLMKKVNAHGFQNYYESQSFQVYHIQNEIIPQLIERTNRLNQKNTIMNKIQGGLLVIQRDIAKFKFGQQRRSQQSKHSGSIHSIPSMQSRILQSKPSSKMQLKRASSSVVNSWNGSQNESNCKLSSFHSSQRQNKVDGQIISPQQQNNSIGNVQQSQNKNSLEYSIIFANQKKMQNQNQQQPPQFVQSEQENHENQIQYNQIQHQNEPSQSSLEYQYPSIASSMGAKLKVIEEGSEHDSQFNNSSNFRSPLRILRKKYTEELKKDLEKFKSGTNKQNQQLVSKSVGQSFSERVRSRQSIMLSMKANNTAFLSFDNAVLDFNHPLQNFSFSELDKQNNYNYDPNHLKEEEKQDLLMQSRSYRPRSLPDKSNKHDYNS